MRFLANGPNIPDLLLERRDQGRVVFFCGAGISLNAGMPTFPELTQHVVDFFDPSPGSEIASAFDPWKDTDSHGPRTPLDQVFHLLYQEYGRDDVNDLVARRLSSKEVSTTELREHKVIARISSDQEGKPQIVTTNFDHLFEQAVKIAPENIHEPPAFPDINLGVPITGITYLHGRLQEPGSKHHSYVLGSADFGRAYLSEAWATRFVRSLLDTYTVVLVGYKAEDPPVRYLLQGLNHDDKSDRSRLYAFDRGTPDAIGAQWRDRGVTPIAYEDHDDLWKTMDAWAERADDPRAWRSQVVDLARQGPRQLDPHERGQVAHLVRTTPGARQFANADTSPTAEWLCVFDASCRAAEVSGGFDPLQAFGLDDDPPRPPDSGQQAHTIHDHLLEWRRGDTNPPAFHRIGGRQAIGFEAMPPRLSYLTRWIVKHLDEPVAAWWAIRQHGLHPRLADGIQREMRRNSDLDPVARQTWNLIIEYQSDHRRLLWGDGWFELKNRIKQDGWSPGVLRDWEAATSPRLSADRPHGLGQSEPPFESWHAITPDKLVRWKVEFPDRHGEEIEIPDDVLVEVFRIAEGHLRRASGLLKDLNKTFFTTPSCYPERDIDGDNQYSKKEVYFLWFLRLFNRLAEYGPEILRAHVITWPVNDEFLFRKLRVYALNRPELFDAEEAAETLLGLDEDSFWDTEVRRELLFLVHDRWDDFGNEHRRSLVDRLLGGPPRRDLWPEDEYPKVRDELAGRYSRWLTLQGLTLDGDQSELLDTIIDGIPEWNDGWASSIITKNSTTVGWIKTDETPDELLKLSDGEVVEKARADLRRDSGSFTNRRPFTGLVKKNPRKALSALTIASRNQDFPIEFWTALIQEWPDQAAPRLTRVFLLRLGRLPYNVIRELRHSIGRWVTQEFKVVLAFNPDIAWTIFDHFVSGLISNREPATESALGYARVGREVIKQSRRTYEHAINGPIGQITEGLLHALNALSLDEGQGIPDEYKTRLDRLLSAPGEGRDHAVSILTHEVSWLHFLDPDWVTERIIAWFSFDHPEAEPAWNGFLSSQQFPSDPIRTLLKDHVLELIPFIYSFDWARDLSQVPASWIVWMAMFRLSEPDGVTIREARHCLRRMDDRTRNHAIFILERIGSKNENGWNELVVPFVENIWPRERKYRTGSSVSSWVSLLVDTGDMFPSVLAAVRRFLVSVEEGSHSLYRFSKTLGDEGSLTSQYPEEVLELLDAVVPDSPDNAPMELAEVLSLIEEKKPDLTKDRRYIRLTNLVENR